MSLTEAPGELQVDLKDGPASDQFGQLFAEELGLVLEVGAQDEQEVMQAFAQAGLAAQPIGSVTQDAQISISINGTQQIAGGSTLCACLCHVCSCGRGNTKGDLSWCWLSLICLRIKTTNSKTLCKCCLIQACSQV